MKYDATLKELLFRQAPTTLLSHVLREPIRVKRPLPTELPSVRGPRADLLFELEDSRTLHAELHNYGDSWFGHRMLQYRLRIQEQYRRVPVQVAFWTAGGPARVPSGIEEELLSYRFHLIELRRVDAEPLLRSDNIGENVLAVLCRSGDPLQTIRRILGLIARQPMPEWRDTVQKLLILSGLRGLQLAVAEESHQMPLTMTIHNNEYLRMLHDEAIALGLEEGLQKGMQKGMQKGAQKAMQKFIAAERKRLEKMLRHRFGKVPLYAQRKIKSADTEKLERWMMRLLDAEKIRDVFE